MENLIASAVIHLETSSFILGGKLDNVLTYIYEGGEDSLYNKRSSNYNLVSSIEIGNDNGYSGIVLNITNGKGDMTFEFYNVMELRNVIESHEKLIEWREYIVERTSVYRGG